MNLLKLFEKDMDIERKPLKISKPVVKSKDEFSTLAKASIKTYLSGKEYAKKYIDQENELALQAVKLNEHNSGRRMDQISIGTYQTNISEFCHEKQMEVLKKYNFEHRPAENLIIFSFKDEIIKTVQTHSVTIIEGSTGCGKSTQVPQFILDSWYHQKKHCNIVVCQPRRIAALAIAARVASERKWALGSLVGCQVGMYKNISNETRITYCTTGVLLRKLISAKNMLEFTHVILDEVHERDQEMDFLILVIRKLLRSNSRSTKVILMSATFNTEKFSEYFAYAVDRKLINNPALINISSSADTPVLINAPVISIAKKRNFKIHIHYLCQLTSLGNVPEVSLDDARVSHHMIQFCIKLINIFDDLDIQSDYDAEDLQEFDGKKPRHAVLVFLPGIWEIEEMHGLMSVNADKSKWDIVVLHSSITNEEQNRVFSAPPKGYRRIILSTNIAESSITINDVAYVVDFCLTKQLVTDPSTNFQCLEVIWASKANCEQRAGRVGRVMDGRVYRLIPKILYEQYFLQENEPEITRCPLDKLVLQTKLLDMGEPKAILALAIDVPDLSNLERTVLLLKEAGGLVDKPDTVNKLDGVLTDLGKIMANMPVDTHLAKLMALGHAFNVLRDTIIMAASMALKSMFNNPFQKRLEAYKAKVHWADGSASDCMAFLNAYHVWRREILANRIKRKTRSERDWGKRNFIQIRVMHEVDYLVNDLTQRLEKLGIKETQGLKKLVINEVDRNFILKVVIAGAFYPNYFVRSHTSLSDNNNSKSGSGTLVAKGLGGLDPTRTVYLQGWKVDQPGKLYAKRIQEIFKETVPLYQQAVVEFDGSSRIYIMFSDEKQYGQEKKWNEIPGNISPSVYNALKMRKLNMEISIPLLDAKNAKKMSETLNIASLTCSMFYNKGNYLQLQNSLPKILPKLPSLSDRTIEIKIVNLLNPSKFWVHLIDENNEKLVNTIGEELNDPDKNVLESIDENKNLKIGDLVAAPWKDGLIYRVIVEGIYEVKKEEVANLYYIDFGYRNSIRRADLYLIKENSKTAEIKALALECTLTGIEPSKRKDGKGNWSPEAYEMFKNFTFPPYVVYGEIYSVVDSVISLVLKCHHPNIREEINLNEELIQEGLSDPVEENYLSKYNHELRTKVLDAPKYQHLYMELMQYDKHFTIRTYPDPPPRNDCNHELPLKGPYSPLEINLISLSITAASKTVSVEGGSVNSVLLDTNPDDPHDRLLVSSIVSQNQSSTALTLRNTTLMPNIPGLTSLLCLIFAPKIEMRRSTTGTTYIGALCGLGYDAESDSPLLPEHDMEVCFDAEISIDDLQNVNRLRHWMNMAIATKQNDQDEDLEEQALHCQKKVFQFLLKLTDAPRKSQQKQKLINFGCWNMYDDSLFLNPTKTVMKDDSIYPLHRALLLEDRDEVQEEMLNHIHQLRYVAMSDPKIPENIEQICLLCNEVLYTREELRCHLFSPKHKDKEDLLKNKK